MIRLNLPTEPYWMEDLPHGIRLYVRPLTTAIYEQAHAKGVRTGTKIMADHYEIEGVGGTVSGLPDLDDEDGRAGLSQLLFAQALAESAIIDWEGVCQDVDGDDPPAAPVTPDNVRKLMMLHSIAEDFVVKYTRSHEKLVMEGNASRPLPSGTSAGAENTAQTAP